MKKVERFKSRKELENYLVERFLEIIKKIDSPKEIAIFLSNLLSDKEKNILSRRLAVTALLKEGKTYKEISEILWISPATISAIKKSLLNSKNYRSNYNLYTNKKAEEEKNTKGLPPETIFDYFARIKWPKIAYTIKSNIKKSK